MTPEEGRVEVSGNLRVDIPRLMMQRTAEIRGYICPKLPGVYSDRFSGRAFLTAPTRMAFLVNPADSDYGSTIYSFVRNSSEQGLDGEYSGGSARVPVELMKNFPEEPSWDELRSLALDTHRLSAEGWRKTELVLSSGKIVRASKELLRRVSDLFAPVSQPGFFEA